MKILAFETSCDDTSVAVVQDTETCEQRILSLKTQGQIENHQAYKGVVPELAARAHLEHIQAVTETALKDANVSLKDITAIAVTSGPGLIGGIIIGLSFAKSLSLSHNIPLFGINHLEGHALTARLSHNVSYPFLLLLTSGGHCQFIYVKKISDYTLIGQTIDDAAGECFDKVANILDLGFPGGPAVESLAKLGNPKAFTFPKPLCNQENSNFSFSGLKTAVLREFQKQNPITETVKADIAASFQHTVAEIFAIKLEKAVALVNNESLKNIVIAGGVAANNVVRQAIAEKANCLGLTSYLPPINLCTDNAAMIGWAAIERLRANFAFSPLTISPTPRWPLSSLN